MHEHSLRIIYYCYFQYTVIIGYCRRCCRNGFRTSINIIVDEAKNETSPDRRHNNIILPTMFFPTLQTL